MQFSRRLKSSAHCLPSPDGRLIATLLPSAISIRLVETLEVVSVIPLPAALAGPVLSFQWAPSSHRLLVAGADQVHVVAALQDDHYHAEICNPLPPADRPAFIGFAGADTAVCVCSSLGLQFALFNLGTSQKVEIGSPKLHNSAAAACRGFSVRAATRHLALLTRAAGKDMVSIHHAATGDVQRSWGPDTLDAHGLVWSPDGRWLVVWESPAHGHKALFYTADGHLFRTWSGPTAEGSDRRALGAGIGSVLFSPDARRLAISDSSRCICIFDMTAVSEALHLQHPTTIAPKDATLQVWQEQVITSLSGASVHTFIRAAQAIYPPGRPQIDRPETARSSCSVVAFDSSSTLLATRLDDAPTTLWIWDVGVSELRGVLVFHAPVSSAVWHPNIPETLLVSCDGPQHLGLVFVWDPLSAGPQSIDFAQQCPERVVAARPRYSWLGDDSQSPTIFFSDGRTCLLAAAGGPDRAPLWCARQDSDGTESPLELVPATTGASSGEDDSGLEPDDTFHFKREPSSCKREAGS